MLRQSLENHVKLAEDLKMYLREFQERLTHTAQSYKHKCNVLCAAGMMEETCQKFEQQYAQQTIRLIVQAAEYINDCDIPFVERYIAKMEQSVPMIRDVYGNIIVKRYGNRFLDNSGNWIYEIRGDRIYDISGSWQYEFRGADRIYDAHGNWKYEIRGDRIYDTLGNWLGYEC